MKKLLLLLLVCTLMLVGCTTNQNDPLEVKQTPFMTNLPELVKNTESIAAYNVLMEKSIRTKTIDPSLFAYLGYTVTQEEMAYFFEETASLEAFYVEQDFTLETASIEPYVFVDRSTNNITSYIVIYYPSGLVKVLATLFIEGTGYTLTYE